MYNSQANYYPPGLDPELNLGLSDHNVLGRVMVFPQAAGVTDLRTAKFKFKLWLQGG